MKTTIKIPTTTTKEVEITFPFYVQRKYDSKYTPDLFYMYPDATCCIKIDGAKIEKLNLAIQSSEFNANVLQEQEEAKAGFYEALALASQELNQHLPKTYFLFGSMAVGLYREYEDADCEASQKVKGIFDNSCFDVCEFSFFDNPSMLLEKASGWEDYAEISREEYIEFMSLISDKSNEKEDREREMTEEDNHLKNSQP